MLCLKKIWKEDLLHLALLLSLLRIDRTVDWNHNAPLIGVGSRDSWDSSWSGLRHDDYINPKNIDSMLSNYERWILYDLNLLGRYSEAISRSQDLTAYVGLAGDDELPSTSGYYDAFEDLHHSISSDLDSPRDWFEDEEKSDSDLTQEDMELIEVLWKQDVDMGFSLEEFQEAAAELSDEPDLEERVKKKELSLGDEQPAAKPPFPPDFEDNEENPTDEEDPWAGLSYTIDLETGEYILKRENESPLPDLSDSVAPSSLLTEADFSLEDALQLVGLNDDKFECSSGDECGEEAAPSPGVSNTPETEEAASLEDQLQIIQEMLQPPANYHRTLQGHQHHHGGHHGHHHHHHGSAQYGPVPRMGGGGYARSVSSEQRWQDLATLLSLPGQQDHLPAAPHTFLPPSAITPAGMKPPDPPYSIGSVVGNTMPLMTNSSEPMGSEPVQTTFKVETPDMMYYQNGSDPNHNSDGFISSILNEEDLLMDMAMNEGMYTMRMLEGGGTNTAGAADSDSAVSSMGSERVPSLTSDTDWMETNSDSGHTPADHFMATTADYHSKFRWYDYNYCRQHAADNSAGSSNARMPPVAQKKYQLYGKRLFQEQAGGTNSGPVVPETNTNLVGGNSVSASSVGTVKFEYGSIPPVPVPPPVYNPSSPLDMAKPHTPQEIKYSCSLEFARQNLCGVRSSPSESAIHNHTYHMPPEHSGVLQRPLTRDKRDCEDLEDICTGNKRDEENSLTRDERRARALAIPISVADVINLPMDEFNERLSKYDLSEAQLSLIRDIRRRGKNKVAAQNCRKRKLDQILSLADEVKIVKDKKQRLQQQRDSLIQERHMIKAKVSQLYRHIFQSMRDEEGNPYSVYEWSLQQNSNGSIEMVRRTNTTSVDCIPSASSTKKPEPPGPRKLP